MEALRLIRTVPGIGDFVFLAQKLINQSEKFNWIISSSPPVRSLQMVSLLPQLINSMWTEDRLGYNRVKRHAYHGKWSNAPQEFYLEANSHLEAGNRIEEFLPDLQTSFLLPYITSYEDKSKAFELLSTIVTEFDLKEISLIGDDNYIVGGNIKSKIKYIGIYTSAYSNARHWGGWTAKEWLQLIRLIQEYDKSYKFVIIGADYDIGIPEDIMSCLKPDEYVNTIGQPLSVVIEILKRLNCFIGFPSGLSIINETLGAKQTIMFYPKHLEKLINAWPEPERIKTGQYKGCLFCQPEQIFNWMVNEGKI